MRYLIFLFLLAGLPPASAIEPIDVGDLTFGYSLNDHVEFVEDRLGRYKASQLMRLDQQWQVHDKETLSFGYTDSVYWFRFKVKNSAAQAVSHLLEIAYPVLDDINLYIFDDHSVQPVAQYQMGDKLPFTTRPVDHRHFVVPLELKSLQDQTWLLRIKTSSAMQVPMTIWPDLDFFLQDQSRIMGLGVYYGIMFIMVLYNLFVFMSVREENYLYYVFYVASMAGFLASLQGLTFQYCWPNATRWNDSALLILLSGVVLFGCLFTRNFLFLSEGEKKLNYLFGLVMLATVCIAMLANMVAYYILIKIMIIIAVLGIILVIYAGLLRWGQGYMIARYFTVAWSFMLLGGAVLALNKFNIIPRNFFTENAVQLGSALEVILLSFALAERLNQEKRERFEAQISALNHERIANAAQTESLEQERCARAAQEKALIHEREAREAQAQALEIQRKANETLEKKVKERTNELESANKKLAKLSTTDALTGVRNRRYFDQVLEHEFNRASRERTQLSILMMDIDHFKAVNDEYGHQVGDEALRVVASVLLEVMHRTTDLAARYGGEEFAIILPNTDMDGALNVAEKIRKKIEARVIDADGEIFSLTVSIGIMGDSPATGDRVDSWLKAADDALYTAKEGGRNQSILAPTVQKRTDLKFSL